MSPELVSLTGRTMMALITLLTGATFALVPWLTRRREAFAVTVPEVAQADPRLRRMRVAYSLAMLALSALAVALSWTLAGTSPVGLAAVVLSLPLAGFLLMLAFRSRVRAIKRAEGWQARHERASAVVGSAAQDAPQVLSLWWNLLYLPVILATLALTAALYPSMPDVVPIHMNATGQVDDTIAKGWVVFAFPAAIQLFLGGAFASSHWMIRRSKRPVSTEAPASSSLAYGAFARAQSLALLAAGMLVQASIALMPLSFAGVISMGHAAVGVAVVCVAACAVTLGTSAAYGQSGTRLLRHTPAARTLDFDDDEHWKAGIFYVNREDPAVILPRRFGVGWAMNWGNPRAWGLTALLALSIAAFVAILQALVG